MGTGVAGDNGLHAQNLVAGVRKREKERVPIQSHMDWERSVVAVRRMLKSAANSQCVVSFFIHDYEV